VFREAISRKIDVRYDLIEIQVGVKVRSISRWAMKLSKRNGTLAVFPGDLNHCAQGCERHGLFV
jgi:hypothetical protein